MAVFVLMPSGLQHPGRRSVVLLVLPDVDIEPGISKEHLDIEVCRLALPDTNLIAAYVALSLHAVLEDREDPEDHHRQRDSQP